MRQGLGALSVALMVLFGASASVAREQVPDDAQAAAERLLGADNAEAQSLVLFRRQFSVEGVVTGSLTDSTSLAKRAIAPSTSLEMPGEIPSKKKALATPIRRGRLSRAVLHDPIKAP